MKKLLLPLVAAAFIPGTIVAQDFDNYVPLRSSGTMPPIFTESLQLQYDQQLKKLAAEGNGPVTQQKKDFLAQNQYNLGSTLLSGKVLFNDPVSEYVSKVADKLLENDKELRSQLSFYILKSSDVNAFSYHQGVVLVNMGLVAQVENEAQLAYILAHEIAHYVKKHALNKYVDFIDIDHGGWRSDKYTSKITYSQESETEADQYGLELYEKSGYSLKEVTGAFDVLQYSYVPFDDIEFNKSFFEDKYLQFPDSFALKTTKTIVSDEDFDDSRSTHPNIRKRKNSVSGRISKDDAGRKKFLNPIEEFRKAQKIARFELCRLYLIERDYPEAIYAAYMLLKKDPNSLYLKKIISKALYNMAAYKAPHRYMDDEHTFSSSTSGFYLSAYENIEGSSQQLYYLLYNLTPEELTTTAISWSWKLKQQYPQDASVSRICDSLLSILVKQGLTPNDFYTQSREELKKEMELKRVNDSLNKVQESKEHDSIVSTEDDGTESKYDKIKKKQKEQNVEVKQGTVEPKGFMYFAFVGLFKDKAFRARFNYFNDLNSHESERRDRNEDNAGSGSRTPGLGIDRLLVFDPIRMQMDSRSYKPKINYFAADQSEKEFINLIDASCKQNQVEDKIFDASEFATMDMATYNDFEIMADWLAETQKLSGNSKALPLATEEIDSVMKKYNCDHMMLSGIVNERIKRIQYPGLFAAGFLIWPLIPAYIVYATTPKYETLYYDVIIDMSSGKVLYKQSDKLTQKDTPANISSRLNKLTARIKRDNAVIGTVRGNGAH